MAAAPRSQLPSLAPLDGERHQRDDDVAHNRSTTHLTTSHPYFSPHSQAPPYNQGALSLSHLANAASKEFDAPADSRRASAEEKELIAGQSIRQSLPSISEALGIDNGSIQPSQAALKPSTTSGFAAPASPMPTMRTYAAEPPQPHAESYATGYRPAYAQNTAPVVSYPPVEPVRSATSGLQPALHLSTPQPSTYSQAQNSGYRHPDVSPVHERPAPPAPAAAPTSFPYGYTPYPPRYAPSSSTQSATSAPTYQPPVASRTTWETENSRYTHMEKSYGESVKRHLDLYDLESALNDISSTSSFLADFARRYGDLLHQSPRSGPSLTQLPSVVEVEDMIGKSRSQTEALIKISETILTRQAAHDEHKADMRHKPYGEFDDSQDDDMKGPDAKKRRGRAAPPGRCHSCNRAETPEWRRGPDGARTLCNACGLHYAKLTRKANSGGKSAAVSSSNLRPKENMP